MVDEDLVVSELVLVEGGDFVGAVDPVGGFSSSAAVRGLIEGTKKKTERRQRCVRVFWWGRLQLYQRWY